MSKANKEKLEEVIIEINNVAIYEGIHPSQVKLSQLVATGRVTAYEVLKLGGLQAIKKAYFPVTDKALKEIHEAKKSSGYIAKLEKALAEKLINEDNIMKTLAKMITPIKIQKANLPKVDKKKHVRRDVVAMVNDTHFGLIVEKDWVNGANEYNWEVASRRMAFFAKQIGEYKIEKRAYVDCLHIILNGDILQGLIHDTQSRTQDLLGAQQNGTLHILTHFIGYVSQLYPKVKVYMGVGNHDQNVTRREGGHRVLSHVASDSFLTPIFYGLSLAFRNNKHIEFRPMSGLYLDINLPGGRACSFHGDLLFSKQLGNPGSNINVRGLSDAINRFNAGEVERGGDRFELFLAAHTHCKANFVTFDGVEFYNAPSLSGTDGYAHSLGINSNLTGQLIFESTKDYIMGDARLISFKTCDKDKTLDAIIPAYKYELKW